MCFFMSFIMTAVHLGIKDHYLLSCLKAFLHGLYIAIPTGLIMGPIIHKLTMKLVK